MFKLSKRITGVVFYVGPSMLDGQLIVGIMIFDSDNEKTGHMAQIIYLLVDVSPTEAIKSGADTAICGPCPHRGTTCYVMVFQSPLSIWRAYHRGNYPVVSLEECCEIIRLRKLDVRFGSYGDSASVPVHITLAQAEAANTITGYTHQWMRKDFDPALLDVLMASVDNKKQIKHVERATGRKDARTYRVTSDLSDIDTGIEEACPHYATGIQCKACGLCDGARRSGAKSIAVQVHGSSAKINHFNSKKLIAVAS